MQSVALSTHNTKELFGLICNIMIDPNDMGTFIGDRALVALIKSLEALAWLYMCQQILIVKNQIPDNLFDELSQMNYWKLDRGKGIGLCYAKRRELEVHNLPERTQAILNKY